MNIVIGAVRRDERGHLHARMTGAPAMSGGTWTPDHVQVSLNKAGRPGAIRIRGGNHNLTWRLGGWFVRRPTPTWIRDLVDQVVSKAPPT